MKPAIISGWPKEFKKLFRTGFFHIFISQVLNKIITLCSGILIVRMLSKTEFGIYSYALNIVSMFLLLSGLGAVSGLLQFGSESADKPQKLAAYSAFAWKMGLAVNVIIVIFIVAFALIFDFKMEGASTILLLMALFPITSEVYSQIAIGFRVRFQNQAFSVFSVLNSTILLACTILGAYFYKIKGVILFQYIGFVVCIIISRILVKRHALSRGFVQELSRDEKKSFFKLSFISSVNNGISQMLYLLDVFVIGIIIGNADIIATYKTATTIPFAMIFVPMAIITYVYPYFALHNKDRGWIRGRYNQLLKGLILLNGIIAAGMYITAPWIINVFFGPIYMDSVKPFQILSIGFFIAATFRIPSGNILVSLHKVMFNFYNAVISGAANIVLNVSLVTRLGSIGAAYATVIVYIISSLASMLYLNQIINTKHEQI